MSESTEKEIVYITKKGHGMTAGIIACVLAVLGIFLFGVVFIPLAIIVALIGTIIAIKNKNLSGIGVNILAWILILVGIITSPAIWVLLGLASGNI